MAIDYVNWDSLIDLRSKAFEAIGTKEFYARHGLNWTGYDNGDGLEELLAAIRLKQDMKGSLCSNGICVHDTDDMTPDYNYCDDCWMYWHIGS